MLDLKRSSLAAGFSSVHQYYVLKKPAVVPVSASASPAAPPNPEIGKRPPGVRPQRPKGDKNKKRK